MSNKWRLYSLDTCQNETNQWEIVRYNLMETLLLEENFTDGELLTILKRRMYVTRRAQLSQIRIDRQFQFVSASSLENRKISIYQSYNNRPLFYLSWDQFQD